MLKLSEYLTRKGKKRKEMVIVTALNTTLRTKKGLVTIRKLPTAKASDIIKARFKYCQDKIKEKELSKSIKLLEERTIEGFFDLPLKDIVVEIHQMERMTKYSLITKHDDHLVYVYWYEEVECTSP